MSAELETRWRAFLASSTRSNGLASSEASCQDVCRIDLVGFQKAASGRFCGSKKVAPGKRRPIAREAMLTRSDFFWSGRPSKSVGDPVVDEEKSAPELGDGLKESPSSEGFVDLDRSSASVCQVEAR